MPCLAVALRNPSRSAMNVYLPWWMMESVVLVPLPRLSGKNSRNSSRW